jgi:hypothetical protein
VRKKKIVRERERSGERLRLEKRIGGRSKEWWCLVVEENE